MRVEMFDDTRRRVRNSGEDHALESFAKSLFELLSSRDDSPFYLDARRWKVAGYVFAKYLGAQESETRKVTHELLQEFSDGVALATSDTSKMGSPVVYDEGAAARVEDRAEKLLALISHEATGDGERSAGERGLAKLLVSGELGLVAAVRLRFLERTVRQLTDVVKLIRERHPGVLLW